MFHHARNFFSAAVKNGLRRSQHGGSGHAECEGDGPVFRRCPAQRGESVRLGDGGAPGWDNPLVFFILNLG